MLELKNICFERDNKKILNNINLKLDNDKFYVITGPNGSGKSTLAKIIMGIDRQDSGQVIFNGKDISNMPINERANLGIGFLYSGANIPISSNSCFSCSNRTYKSPAPAKEISLAYIW